MSLEFCVLGSGSSGNSTVVRAAAGAFLIDAGFGPRATEQRLHGTGLAVKDISAIVLTHLDSDHFNGNWLLTIARQGIKIHLARQRVRDFLKLPEVRDLQARVEKQALWDAPEPPVLTATAREQNQKSKIKNQKLLPIESLLVPFSSDLEPVEGVHLRAIHLAHDQAGSHGFVLTSGTYRAGYATDLCAVPESLLEAFCGVDLLALESNYDSDMELNSDRPYYLKQRIMGGSGHLSNDQALAAIRAILDRTANAHGPDRLPRHIVLLHRSRQCNCPKLVKRMFSQDPRVAPVLTLTHQHERTAWLHANRPRAQQVEQLALAWG